MTLQDLISASKDVLAGTLEASGVLWHRLDQMLDGCVLVLMYHRVLPEQQRDSFSSPGIIVTPETFDRHLGWIRTHFQPLAASEFGAIIDGTSPPPKRACLVTFDDGWYDNLAHALPVLERHQVPAILFAATGFVGTSHCFWQERLGRLLDAAWRKGPEGAALLRQVGVNSARGLTEAHARTVIRGAVTRLKAQSPSEIAAHVMAVEDGLTELAVALPTGWGDDRFLSWSELGQVAASRLMTIGSHAISHVPLPRLVPGEIASELSGSRETLQARLSMPVEWFAYPNGDHDATSANLVRKAGYRGAFTTVGGPVAVGADPYTLRRVNMHEASTRTIGRFLSGMVGLL